MSRHLDAGQRARHARIIVAARRRYRARLALMARTSWLR